MRLEYKADYNIAMWKKKGKQDFKKGSMIKCYPSYAP